MNCPEGHGDAGVTSVAAPGGGKLYTCFFSHESGGPISWEVVGKAAVITTEGVTAELVQPFEQILAALPHVWVEYGVLEYRLREDYPDLFASHVAARGHVLTGAHQGTASSVRFAAALLRLDRAKAVVYEMRHATGAWSYNSKVGFWALTPPPPFEAILTWEAYCNENGRPAGWTDEDKQVVTEMAASASPAN